MPDLIDRLKSIAARWEGGGGLCERDDVLEAIQEIERLAQDNVKLRESLAFAYSGLARLYFDDGELTDTSETPFIDYRRQTVDEIQQAIEQRGLNRLAALTPQEPKR